MLGDINTDTIVAGAQSVKGTAVYREDRDYEGINLEDGEEIDFQIREKDNGLEGTKAKVTLNINGRHTFEYSSDELFDYTSPDMTSIQPNQTTKMDFSSSYLEKDVSTYVEAALSDWNNQE